MHYRKAKELLEELKAEIAKNRENEEFMRFQHKELDDANLQEGELGTAGTGSRNPEPFGGHQDRSLSKQTMRFRATTTAYSTN